MIKREKIILLLIVFVSVFSENVNAQTCDYSTDYSTNTGWLSTGTGISIAGSGASSVNFNNCTGNSSSRVYRPHNVVLTDHWKLDFFFRFTSTTVPGHILGGVTETNEDPIAAASPWTTHTMNDGIFSVFAGTSSTAPSSSWNLQTFKKNGQTIVATTGFLLSANTDYYITLERLDQTNGRVTVYSDAARLNAIPGKTENFTIDAGIQLDLPYLQHGVTSTSASTRSLTGVVDDVCLANYVDISAAIGTIEMDQTQVNVSPNPTNGICKIDLNGLTSEKVVVYNLLGKEVSETIVTENTRSLDIDLSELPASIYMIHIHTGGEVILKKVIKN